MYCERLATFRRDNFSLIYCERFCHLLTTAACAVLPGGAVCGAPAAAQPLRRPRRPGLAARQWRAGPAAGGPASGAPRGSPAQANRRNGRERQTTGKEEKGRLLGGPIEAPFVPTGAF